jgi:hypothetical protein
LETLVSEKKQLDIQNLENSQEIASLSKKVKMGSESNIDALERLKTITIDRDNMASKIKV